MSRRSKLQAAFYQRDDVVGISQELLGKVLCSNVGGVLTSAIITETEAYAGVSDKASHAYGDRRTPRTETLYADGGIAYVYLCYGIHHLFNVVTSVVDTPHAVLIRAAIPHDNIAEIKRRRKRNVTETKLLNGPGTLSQGLAIQTSMTGTDLSDDVIWIEDRDVVPTRIEAGPRIGVDYAAEDALLPYRFVAAL